MAFVFIFCYGVCSNWPRDDLDHQRNIEHGLPRNHSLSVSRWRHQSAAQRPPPPQPTRQTMERFLEVKWSAISFGDDGRCTDCAICLDGFRIGDQCRVGSICKNLFHKYCIDRWLETKKLCPLCRGRVEN
ncbi:hypothetical protein QYF36_012872 [Acer negundo]|nr:hypothetical protein QYF36_012872 [Acer negundo]